MHSQTQDKKFCVWSPTDKIDQDQLDSFVKLAKGQYNYSSEEQALGILFWRGYDLDRARQDLPHFCPLPDVWNEEDKIIFEEAVVRYKKNFKLIQQMLPEKSLASLVQHYFNRTRPTADRGYGGGA